VHSNLKNLFGLDKSGDSDEPPRDEDYEQDNRSDDSSSRTNSTFYQKYVKHKVSAANQSSKVDHDVNAFNNFKNYPNRNVSLFYEDVCKPQIFWAQQKNFQG
jgi:hypothetical protein